MDLTTLQAVSDGAVLTVRNPVTAEPLEGVTVTLLSIDNPAVKAVRNANVNRRLEAQGRAKVTVEKMDVEATDILVAATVSWTGVELDGAALECNPANARKLYTRAGLEWLRDQVDKFIGDVANFVRG